MYKCNNHVVYYSKRSRTDDIWDAFRWDRTGNPVRFIEAFVEKVDLLQLGFEQKKVKEEGRPAFDPKY